MKKTCVIGWPIGHSRSPLIHNYWIKQLGLKSVYEKLAVEPGKLQDFITDLPQSNFLGCNVTLPHKEHVFQLVKNREETASRLGSINTLYIRNGELHGVSTDGEGFWASLQKAYPDYSLVNKKALVLGAGGAARAVIDSLLQHKIEKVIVFNRSSEKTAGIITQFGPKVSSGKIEDHSKECDILINTTSLGMSGQPELVFDVMPLRKSCLVADLIYTPLKTNLLLSAEQRKLSVLNGLGMLLHQAVRGFELWYGVRPEVTAQLTALVEEDVQKASRS